MGLKGKRIMELGSVDSTNAYADRLLKEGSVQEGTIIWSKEQTAGKGQGRNNWLSEPGKNLTISIIFYPRFLPAEDQFMLNKSVTLATLDFANDLLPGGACKIKWPNDIYYGPGKLGGILISNTVSGSRLDSSVIGIGININQTRFDPAIPNPTSVKTVLAEETDLGYALEKLIDKLDLYYDLLKRRNMKELDKSYRSNLLGIDQPGKFRSGNEIFSGSIFDVNRFGSLIIETPGKGKLVFAHKEVEYVF
jgi:BirA family transcriptional regulator, biotin operon repressor / biotin---[acetyl-CoA-carboxylase] ligase